jgi:copper transport protein
MLSLCVVAALATAPSAVAHATLVDSDPSDGTVVAAAPQQVRLSFDDKIRAQPGMKAIRNTGESVLAGTPRVIGGRQLVIPLRSGLRSGDYTVLWRALSDDGHPLAGVVAFGVGAGRAPPHAALAAPSTTSPLEVFVRWLFFAGVLAACGVALFELAVPRAAAPPDELYVGAFLLVVAGGPALAARASLDTRFGVVVAVASLVAAGGALMAGFTHRRAGLARGARIAALLLLPALSLSGHALDRGQSPVQLPADILHVAASSVWLGGLLALGLQLRRDAPREPVLREFSRLAAISVGVLAATGALRAFGELGSISEIWGTSYGRLLLVKTVLFASLLALGWMNRYRLIPALMRSLPRLRRNMRAELGVFLALVAAVAILTQLRPGTERDGRLEARAATRKPAAPGGTEGLVLGQSRGGVQLSSRVLNAVAEDGRHVVFETASTERGSTASLVRLDLQTRRTSTLARGVAAQYGLAVVGHRAAYVTDTSPPKLVSVQTGGGGRQVLASALAAPIASRGARVAWATQSGGRQRVVVRDVRRGRDFVVADMPRCDRAGCYRVDAVTLADQGVTFDRGAIGPQPSRVVRREFASRRPQSVSIRNDPQPDLIPSSAGAAYFALGRGWYRWDFGTVNPVPTRYGATGPASPTRYEAGRWYLTRSATCGDTVESAREDGRLRTVMSGAEALAIAGNPSNVCAKLSGLTDTAGRIVTTWAISPADTHSEAGVTSVITVGKPGG